MRVPLEWLYQYCRPDMRVRTLAERLTMTGTNVEAIHHHGVAGLEHFVVGKVLKAEQHPNADRLRVCVVDVGGQRPVTIVCGAPNVAAGQVVAVARPGAVMPDRTELGKAKLRGIESDGMILAEDEVGIGTDHSGTMVLSEPALTPGSPLATVLPISTDVLELEITSNRPDCLGVYGVAREVHAATGAPLNPPLWEHDPGTDGSVDGAEVAVESPELCARFTARVFEAVSLGPSPRWLKARLMAAGQRPISNVVDITNYVMLLTGQPMHAFDLDRIAGGKLTVRLAADGEQVQTLDGQTRTLDDRMLLIADEDGPTSIAGVMGGARSEVHEGTSRVLMEAASWDGPSIHHAAWSLGLQSEASSRFEKQLQPEQTMEAQAVAAQLMIELCGARLAPGTIDVGGAGPAPATLRLRDARIEGLLGAPIERDRSVEILTALEFGVADADDGLDVTVPFFRRGDVTREVDLVEEVARIDGLEKLPATLPSRHNASARLTAAQRLRRRAADALTAQGLHEIVGWSFTGSQLAARLRLTGAQQALELENPMSGEQSLLRTTLVGSLLDAAARNRARGAATVRLFEAGAVYLPSEPGKLPREPQHLGALVIGAVRRATWLDPAPRTADFYAAKGVVGRLFETLRVPWRVEVGDEPFLHPGRAARIMLAGKPAGWLGEIHPSVAANWDLDDIVAGFELDLDLVIAQAPEIERYEDQTSFPAIVEDLAVVVADAIAASDVLAVVERAGAPLLTGAAVFDVYRDDGRLGAGNVSLALRLTYRAPDRTLTDEEVAERRGAIAAALAAELDGRVRDA